MRQVDRNQMVLSETTGSVRDPQRHRAPEPGSDDSHSDRRSQLGSKKVHSAGVSLPRARWRRRRFLAGLPALGVEQVLLQQAEEGLRGGVVASPADAAHGADEIVVVEQSA